MKIELINSKTSIDELKLDGTNHIFASLAHAFDNRLLEKVYGLSEGKISTIYPKNYKFPGKVISNSSVEEFEQFKEFFKTDDFEGYDIILYHIGDIYWWEPLQERIKREAFFSSNPNTIMYSWGYIDGTYSFLGFRTNYSNTISGYRMWQDATIMEKK